MLRLLHQESSAMKLHRMHVIKRATDRGYDPDTIEPCFVKHLYGDVWEVDVTHPAYPHARGPEPEVQPAPIGEGPGTELKKLLSRFGLGANEGCACSSRAKTMNELGTEWVSNNVDTVVGWLREEAMRRRMPFVRAIARLLVKWAVRNARRSSAA